MPSIVSTNFAAATTRLIAAEAISALMDNLLMGNLIYRNFDSVPAKIGDTVDMPISVSSNTPFVLKAVEATFQIPDLTRIINNSDLVKLYMEPSIVAIAEKIELDLLSSTASFPVIAISTIPTPHEIIDDIDNMFYPNRKDKYLIMSLSDYCIFSQDSRFSAYREASEIGLNHIRGAVGRLGDFYIFKSPHIHKTSPAKHGFAFTQHALGFITRRLEHHPENTNKISEYAEVGNLGIRVTMDFQPDTLSQQFTIDILYSTGPLQNKHGLRIKKFEDTNQ